MSSSSGPLLLATPPADALHHPRTPPKASPTTNTTNTKMTTAAAMAMASSSSASASSSSTVHDHSNGGLRWRSEGGVGDEEGEVQFLVRLLNVTHVLTFPSHHNRGGWRDPILSALSARTGIPSTHLILHTPKHCSTSSYSSDDDDDDGGRGSGSGRVHFLSASLRLYLRGGKGGFGTQLKSASKRAAAKTTLDFGACRDLSGRRLRHVNDEVKLRKWREYNSRRERGLHVDEMEYARTKSGIHNWHLDVPNWALELFSEKAVRENQRRIVREMERQRREEEKVVEDERRRRLQRERAVLDYARVVSGGDDGGRDEEDRMEDAVAQGMRRRMELMAKRQRERRKGKEPAAAANGMGGGAGDVGEELPKQMEAGDSSSFSSAAATAGEEDTARSRKASKLGPGDVHVASASTATAPASAAVSSAVGDDAPGAAAAAASSSEGVMGHVDVSGVSGCEWFCSLSGDFLEPEPEETGPGREDDGEATGGGGDGNGEMRVQAASDFSTGCVLLPSSSSTASDADVRDGGLVGGKWYYEVVLETAGMAQLGWATRGFNPDSQEGDGVGDDNFGYGYDGSRGLTFHAPPPPSTSPPPGSAPTVMGGAEPQTSASVEEGVNTYPSKKAMATITSGTSATATTTPWRPNDVVGCVLDADKRTVSYSIDGVDLGVAFRYGSDNLWNTAASPPASSSNPPPGVGGASSTVLPSGGGKNGDVGGGGGDGGGGDVIGLFPAISLNRGEVVRLRIGPRFDHLPEGYRGVYQIMRKRLDDRSPNIALGVGVKSDERKQMTGTQGTNSSVASSASQLLLPPKLEDSGMGGSPSKKEKTNDAPNARFSDTIGVASRFPAPTSSSRSERESLPEPLDLSSFESASELEKLGLDRLKSALIAIGVKCGGSLDERAKRLFSLKGLKREDYPMKVRSKNFVP